MKKGKFVFVCLAMLSFFACSGSSTIEIVGSVTNEKFNDKKLFLFSINPNDEYQSFNQLSTASIQNGSFNFSLDINDGLKMQLPTIGYLASFDMNNKNLQDNATEDFLITTFILEPGTIQVTFDSSSVILSGTDKNNEFNKIHQTIKEIVDLVALTDSTNNVSSIPTDTEGRDGRAQFQLLNETFKELTYNFVKTNMDNNIGEYLFPTSYRDNMFTPTQVKELISLGSEAFQSKENIKEISKTMDGMNDPSNELETESIITE